MTSTFALTTWCPVGAGAMFHLSLDIDAHVASMAGSGERAVGGVRSGSIGLGESVTWHARHLGVWFTMTSQIAELDRPRRFVDAQTRGPFASFRHEHAFEDVVGGCRMTDTITLASPVLGAVVEPLVLVPYLRRLIRRRNRVLVGAVSGR
ncbi:SRPBCC family protein [Brachybacterium sp. AOP25-B2-12]|uniref:SRPBCC family protein n=1 Tax=Brachybacterium sp. AOP25-B2-12 TaxID=3457710 RepID=UPI004033CEA4